MCSHPGSQNEESDLESKKVEITDCRERDVALKILIVQEVAGTQMETWEL